MGVWGGGRGTGREEKALFLPRGEQRDTKPIRTACARSLGIIHGVGNCLTRLIVSLLSDNPFGADHFSSAVRPSGLPPGEGKRGRRASREVTKYVR